MTFPISRVIVRAYESLCFRRISAACDRYAPRSFGASRDHVWNASRAFCTFARTSADVAIECVASGLPVAGLITWNVRCFAAARPRAPRLESGRQVLGRTLRLRHKLAFVDATSEVATRRSAGSRRKFNNESRNESGACVGGPAWSKAQR